MSPGLERFVIAGAADEFFGLRVVEEGNPAAAAFVQIFQKFGVFFVVPGFQVLEFDSVIVFKTFNDGIHFVAVTTFCSAELEQVVCEIWHGE